MSTEKAFIRKLNARRGLTGVYSFGTTGANVNGIPDRYYEGTRACTWVEFKFLKKQTHSYQPKILTNLQLIWLERNWRNNQHPHVIVGLGLKCGLIFDKPHEWNSIWTPDQYDSIIFTIDEIADYLRKFCNGTR